MFNDDNWLGHIDWIQMRIIFHPLLSTGYPGQAIR